MKANQANCHTQERPSRAVSRAPDWIIVCFCCGAGCHIERNASVMKDNERTLEQVYRSAVAGLYARLKSNYVFLYKRFGDDGLKLIEEMSREYGISVAERAKAKLPNNDLASVAEYLLRIFDTISRGRDMITTTEKGEDRIVIKVNRCPLDFEIPAMCLAHTAMERAVVSGLNPKLDYRIGKSIPAGDDCCEHILEIIK
jgi:hypothetical protein